MIQNMQNYDFPFFFRQVFELQDNCRGYGSKAKQTGSECHIKVQKPGGKNMINIGINCAGLCIFIPRR